MTSKLTRERLQEITLRLTRLDVLETILRNELGLPCESPIPDIAEKIYDMKRSRIYSVVPEEWTIADAVKFCRETGRQDAGAAMDAWNACRAAMLQAQSLHAVKTAPALGSLPKTGEVLHTNSPVIPDGYVMVPKDPTAEMVIKMRYHVGGYDRNIKEGYKAMLAAADCSIPMISDRWIPVSERVPTKQDGSVFLTWNGQYIGKELFLMGSFQCLKPEIITHWMQLPAAPQEVKSES
ncbi:DUF551 domain-containing protein [Klebsiella oxytoca]|nr:DUF551 domain-containing protein [Klebsiella oxytoca]